MPLYKHGNVAENGKYVYLESRSRSNYCHVVCGTAASALTVCFGAKLFYIYVNESESCEQDQMYL